VSVPKLDAQEVRGFYLWNNTSALVPFNHLYDLKFSTKTQYNVNGQMRDMTYLDFAIYRKMNDWFRLGVAFRGSQLVKESGDIYEYRPQLVSIITLNPSEVKWQTTNRLEHRSFSRGSSHFRYYHNIYAHFPSFPHFPKPYLGEEIFTKLNDENIHIVRAHGGLHLIEHERFRIDFYYAWQKSRSGGEWFASDVLGLNLTFRIKPRNGMLYLPAN